MASKHKVKILQFARTLLEILLERFDQLPIEFLLLLTSGTSHSRSPTFLTPPVLSKAPQQRHSLVKYGVRILVEFLCDVITGPRVYLDTVAGSGTFLSNHCGITAISLAGLATPTFMFATSVMLRAVVDSSEVIVEYPHLAPLVHALGSKHRKELTDSLQRLMVRLHTSLSLSLAILTQQDSHALFQSSYSSKDLSIDPPENENECAMCIGAHFIAGGKSLFRALHKRAHGVPGFLFRFLAANIPEISRFLTKTHADKSGSTISLMKLSDFPLSHSGGPMRKSGAFSIQVVSVAGSLAEAQSTCTFINSLCLN